VGGKAIAPSVNGKNETRTPEKTTIEQGGSRMKTEKVSKTEEDRGSRP